MNSELQTLKNESGEAFFGAESWQEQPELYTKLYQFLCLNHTRGLPVDAYNWLFDAFLNDNLGEAFKVACARTGSRNRLEKSGTALLRSICKLVCDGHGAYAKGDGLEFRAFLEDHYPGLAARSIGRAEQGQRQDWSLEISAKILPLVPPHSVVPRRAAGP